MALIQQRWSAAPDKSGRPVLSAHEISLTKKGVDLSQVRSKFIMSIHRYILTHTLRFGILIPEGVFHVENEKAVSV